MKRAAAAGGAGGAAVSNESPVMPRGGQRRAGKGGDRKKRASAPSDACQKCLAEGKQRGITHWHREHSRSTGGICKEHAQELHELDPAGFESTYRMRHGRPCEICGILRRATHGLISEGVARFCGECASGQSGCIDVNNFKCKVTGCNRMARFIGEVEGRLAFRCWVHKSQDMREAGEAWRDFYQDFVVRTTGANSGDADGRLSAGGGAIKPEDDASGDSSPCSTHTALVQQHHHPTPAQHEHEDHYDPNPFQHHHHMPHNQHHHHHHQVHDHEGLSAMSAML